MNNKYLYSFLKDSSLRTLCILSVVGVVLCIVLIRLNIKESLALKDIQMKQAIIDQLPALKLKIVNTKVVSKGVTLTLNGIVLNDIKPMAIINNTIIKVGGKIEGKVVSAITKHSVTLCNQESADKCITLLLEQ